MCVASTFATDCASKPRHGPGNRAEALLVSFSHGLLLALHMWSDLKGPPYHDMPYHQVWMFDSNSEQYMSVAPFFW